MIWSWKLGHRLHFRLQHHGQYHALQSLDAFQSPTHNQIWKIPVALLSSPRCVWIRASNLFQALSLGWVIENDSFDHSTKFNENHANQEISRNRYFFNLRAYPQPCARLHSVVRAWEREAKFNFICERSEREITQLGNVFNCFIIIVSFIYGRFAFVGGTKK